MYWIYAGFVYQMIGWWTEYLNSDGQQKEEDDWSDEEKKLAAEYEKKVKELNEEREKYRKVATFQLFTLLLWYFGLEKITGLSPCVIELLFKKKYQYCSSFASTHESVKKTKDRTYNNKKSKT